MTWQEVLRERWWPGDRWVQPTDEIMQWLESKHEVAQRITPATVGEIGVRAGYSAFAIMSAVPTARYLGIGLENPDDPGSMDHADVVLAGFQYMVVRANSHDIDRLPPFDLLHVDGDHTGCEADLRLALDSGVKWALVDDFFASRFVPEAVDRFVNATPAQVVQRIDDGSRGSALLELNP